MDSGDRHEHTQKQNITVHLLVVGDNELSKIWQHKCGERTFKNKRRDFFKLLSEGGFKEPERNINVRIKLKGKFSFKDIEFQSFP